MKKHEMNLAEALEQFLKQSGFQKQQKIAEIPNHLDEVLGKNLASAIENIFFEKKKIILVVKNSVWKQEFKLRRKELLFLIHDWLGFDAFEEIEIK